MHGTENSLIFIRATQTQVHKLVSKIV